MTKKDLLPDVGSLAPDFTLPDDQGRQVRLSDLRGRRVLIYFYPKDMTSGCTRQAQGLRDHYQEFVDRDVVVLGISPDPVERHVKFKMKENLPFTLLADVDHTVAQQYGVWQEKNMYGRKYMGIVRSSFIVDEEGKISHVFFRVQPKKHVEQVLKALDEPRGEPA